ncbi:dolichyl-phosphate mannose synthase [archaeon]|jgi:glycosyltransferase involved in cell wall biosynthesis|nr:dolichyl-phosphate mannose synthase [archaeon]MDP6548336.1 glycosyltransferase family 2 protein [Candidatus Woesearchaeota archaeon]|tara:strand:+ start:12738 stop:13400 length:663 start_codon:yes stop_codon:yes gene_type:complete
MKSKTFAIVPAYNEEKHINKIVKEIRKYVDEVVVVDDGSNDRTKEIAEKSKAVVLKHIINLGKGATLKTGCDYAVKNNAKVMIAIDADAQHDTKEIPKFLESIKSSDIVLGYRKPSKHMPLILKLGNGFINKTIKFLYGVSIRDSQCGYRAFTAKAYRKLRWKASDYSMESEMIAKIGRHKLKYKEIPIETIYSDKYKGTTILDGFKIVFNLLFWKLNKN